MKVALIGCSKSKLKVSAPAIELYQGALFKKAFRFAQEDCDCAYILSARYGLILPGKVIAPYDVTMNDLTREERFDWGMRVYISLLERLDPKMTTLVLLAGAKYCEPLELRNEGRRKNGYTPFVIETPLQGLSIGRSLQRLSGVSRPRAVSAS